MRLHFPVLCLSALALVVPSPAGAAVVERVTTSGSVTATWTGDPARGCAEQGVCDVSGTSVLVPRRDEGESSSSGGDAESASVGVDFAEARVRVVRGPASAPLGVCADAGPTDAGLQLSTYRGGAVDVSFGAAAGLSAGRCAGPTAADLAAQPFPGTPLPGRALRGASVRLDLSGARTFGAGPYTVTLTSTVEVQVRRRTEPEPGGHNGGEGPEDEEEQGRRRGFLLLTYDVALSGALTGRYTGLVGRGCELFDACDLSGSLALRPRRRTLGRVTLAAAGAPRDARDVRTAMRALRAGRLRVVDEVDLRGEPVRFDLEASAQRAGTTGACRDAATMDPPDLDVDRDGEAVELELEAGSSGFELPPVARTRCPGPVLSTTFAGARVTVEELAAERVAAPLRLRGTGSWPYALVPTGALELRLRRTAARARVRTVFE